MILRWLGARPRGTNSRLPEHVVRVNETVEPRVDNSIHHRDMRAVRLGFLSETAKKDGNRFVCSDVVHPLLVSRGWPGTSLSQDRQLSTVRI